MDVRIVPYEEQYKGRVFAFTDAWEGAINRQNATEDVMLFLSIMCAVRLPVMNRRSACLLRGVPLCPVSPGFFFAGRHCRFYSSAWAKAFQRPLMMNLEKVPMAPQVHKRRISKTVDKERE